MALDLIAELEALVDALEAGGVEYAICGGIALAIHGHPRATMDIDLLVTAEQLPRAGRITLPLAGRHLTVVSRSGLATMKRLAGRTQDLADLEKLEGADDDES